MRHRLSKEEVAALHGRCKASSVIRHLADLSRDRLLAVPYMRVSSREQKSAANLANRMKALRQRLACKGIRWEETFREVAKGNDLTKRPKLVEAVEFAKDLQAKNPDALVVLVTDARNRFIRGRHYNGYASSDRLDDDQLAELKKLVKGVPLATVFPPDTLFGEVRAYETKVGRIGHKVVGRPKSKPMPQPGYKKQRRLSLQSEARRLRDEEHLSYRQIGKRLAVPASTVRSWLPRPTS
jgi:hypothetical protein